MTPQPLTSPLLLALGFEPFTPEPGTLHLRDTIYWDARGGVTIADVPCRGCVTFDDLGELARLMGLALKDSPEVINTTEATPSPTGLTGATT